MLKHQVVAVGGEHVLVSHAHRLQRVLALGRRSPLAVVGHRLRECVCDALKAAFQRREEELALAREQAEHVRLRHAHAPGDPIDRRAVQPPFGELVHGRGDQLLAPLGRGHPPADLLGLPGSAPAPPDQLPRLGARTDSVVDPGPGPGPHGLPRNPHARPRPADSTPDFPGWAPANPVTPPPRPRSPPHPRGTALGAPATSAQPHVPTQRPNASETAAPAPSARPHRAPPRRPTWRGSGR